jgi:hypothetical protein
MTRTKHSKPAPSDLQASISKLTAEKARVDRELTSLRRQADSARPWLDCLRCGHRWQGLWLNKPPRYCARCHSAGWNTPPVLSNTRKPTDSPNPKWDRRSKKLRVESEPVPVPPASATVPTFEAAPELRPAVPIAEPEIVWGLPPLGLTPPPSLSIGLPPPPIPALTPPARFEEPQGESSARPAEPEPEWSVEPDELPILGPEPEQEVPDANPEPDPEPDPEPSPGE